MLAQEYLRRILKARVYDVAQETPLDYAVHLSEKLDNKVLLKRTANIGKVLRITFISL